MNEIALQTIGLTKRYGSLAAVQDLSLEVKRGEIFGFLGPNGAGKTTSINMMVGLTTPTEGDVFIDGLSLRTGGTRLLCRLGVCPQETLIWEKLTCLEQLEFAGVCYNLPPLEARKRGKQLLDDLGLAAKTNELAGRLSGGMKRRLNLALGLVHDPAILFLDEPEAGLDPQSRVLVRDYIRMLARRKTVILTTHNMDEADRLADRVAIIDHGRLLVIDTPDALKRGLGQAGMLEIELEAGGADIAGPVLETLRRACAEASLRGDTLVLRGADMPARLPEFLGILQSAGIHTSDVHIRAVTLEDVFLSLTGRGLRE
jgi:ABC-2 type transport system ATP-binding protein